MTVSGWLSIGGREPAKKAEVGKRERKVERKEGKSESKRERRNEKGREATSRVVHVKHVGERSS